MTANDYKIQLSLFKFFSETMPGILFLVLVTLFKKYIIARRMFREVSLNWFLRLRGCHLMNNSAGWVDAWRLFTLAEEVRTRRHNLKIRTFSFKTDMRSTFFSQMVMTFWNSLLQWDVEFRFRFIVAMCVEVEWKVLFCMLSNTIYKYNNA